MRPTSLLAALASLSCACLSTLAAETVGPSKPVAAQTLTADTEQTFSHIIRDLVKRTLAGDFDAAARILDLGITDSWMASDEARFFIPPQAWTAANPQFDLSGRQVYGAFCCIRLIAWSGPDGPHPQSYAAAMTDMLSRETTNGPYTLLMSEFARDHVNSADDQQILSMRVAAAVARMGAPDPAMSPLRRACRHALVGRMYMNLSNANGDLVHSYVTAQNAESAFNKALILFRDMKDPRTAEFMRNKRDEAGARVVELGGNLSQRDLRGAQTVETFGAPPIPK